MSYHQPFLFTGGQGLGAYGLGVTMTTTHPDGHVTTSQVPDWLPWAVGGGLLVLVVGALVLKGTADYEVGKAFSPDENHKKEFAVAGTALGMQYGLPGLALLGAVGVLMKNADNKATAGLSAACGV